MSQIKNIDELEIGMILAEPVHNSFGQILLQKGHELNSKSIKVLKTWNVRVVYVHDSNTDINIEEELNSEILELAKEKIKSRMEWEPRNDNEIDLFNTAVEITARQLLKGI